MHSNGVSNVAFKLADRCLVALNVTAKPAKASLDGFFKPKSTSAEKRKAPSDASTSNPAPAKKATTVIKKKSKPGNSAFSKMLKKK